MKAICTGCQRMKNIILKFEAEVNGRRVEERLCRDCLQKRAKAQESPKKK